MKTAFLTALATCFATQSVALSCLAPDVARSFTQAANAEERYIILLGTFAFEEAGEEAGKGRPSARQDAEFQSDFDGQYLTQDGFQTAPTLAVDLRFTCAGIWCGTMQSYGAQVLAFVEQTDAGYTLDIGPCGGQAFTDPTPEQVNQVVACMRGDTCEPTAFQ